MARSYWAESVKDEIIKKYLDKNLKYSKRKLVQEFHIGNRTLNRLFKENGITHKTKSQCLKKYQINEKYFSKIETERQAYWLGLLYADGNIRSKQYGITLGLSQIDGYLVDELRSDLEYTGPITIKKGQKKTHNDQYVLRISSPTMHSDLNNLGCIPKKSLKLKFPKKTQVPIHLINHFVRGYFDGDGTIGIYKDKRCNGYNINTKIVSSYKFCTDLKKILKSIINLDTSVYYENKIHKLTGSVGITGYKKSAKFLEWLYKDATIYMIRKHTKYLEILDYIQDREGKKCQIN